MGQLLVGSSQWPASQVSAERRGANHSTSSGQALVQPAIPAFGTSPTIAKGRQLWATRGVYGLKVQAVWPSASKHLSYVFSRSSCTIQASPLIALMLRSRSRTVTRNFQPGGSFSLLPKSASRSYVRFGSTIWADACITHVLPSGSSNRKTGLPATNPITEFLWPMVGL